VPFEKGFPVDCREHDDGYPLKVGGTLEITVKLDAALMGYHHVDNNYGRFFFDNLSESVGSGLGQNDVVSLRGEQIGDKKTRIRYVIDNENLLHSCGGHASPPPCGQKNFCGLSGRMR
jgi:hypothetical protein